MDVKKVVAYAVSARIFLRHPAKFGRKKSGCEKMGAKNEFPVEYVHKSILWL